MAHSPYLKLVNRVSHLGDSFLPNVKLNGTYTRKEQDYISSYLLLVHAEIEDFIERAVSVKLTSSLKKWRDLAAGSNVLIAVVSYYSDEVDWSKVQNSSDLKTRVHRSVKKFQEVIDSNHGVKKDNIFKLLKPLGVDVGVIDDTWLTEMDQFASRRGLVAHKSHKSHTILDPATEENHIVNIILPELSNVYNMIKSA